MDSLVAQKGKHLPAMWETQVRSPGQEDPLEKEMATHFRLLPGKSHGGQETWPVAWWATVHGVAKELKITEQLDNNKSIL